MEPRPASGGFEAGVSEPGQDRVATDGDVTSSPVHRGFGNARETAPNR